MRHFKVKFEFFLRLIIVKKTKNLIQTEIFFGSSNESRVQSNIIKKYFANYFVLHLITLIINVIISLRPFCMFFHNDNEIHNHLGIIGKLIISYGFSDMLNFVYREIKSHRKFCLRPMTHAAVWLKRLPKIKSERNEWVVTDLAAWRF